MKRWSCVFVLATGLSALVFSSQICSPTNLFLEGLYVEKTEGDLDKAIELYHKVLDKAGEVQRLAANATYQLGMCYLKKGDKGKAADFYLPPRREEKRRLRRQQP